MELNVPVITRADREEEVQCLHSIGVRGIVQPKFEAGLEMMRQTLLQLDVSALEIQNYVDSVRNEYFTQHDMQSPQLLASKMRSFSGIIELNWVKLPEDSRLAGRSLADTQVRKVTGASVVGVMRGDDPPISNPAPGFILKAGDMLALIGTRDQCENFERLCGAGLAATPAAAEIAASAENAVETEPGAKK